MLIALKINNKEALFQGQFVTSLDRMTSRKAERKMLKEE